MATHLVRSRQDLAKPYLQVVHSGVLASSDSPLTPRWKKCQTCAWHFGQERLQRCFAQKLGWLDFRGCGSLDLGEICQFRPAKCVACQFERSHFYKFPREIPLKSTTYSGGTSLAFPRVPARARHDGCENLFDQDPSLAHLWRVPLTRTLVLERRDGETRGICVRVRESIMMFCNITSVTSSLL